MKFPKSVTNLRCTAHDSPFMVLRARVSPARCFQCRNRPLYRRIVTRLASRHFLTCDKSSRRGCISANRGASTRAHATTRRKVPGSVRIRRKLFRGVDWRMTKSRKPPANRCSGNFPRTLNPFDRYINITRSGAACYSNVSYTMR